MSGRLKLTLAVAAGRRSWTFIFPALNSLSKNLVSLTGSA